MNYDARRAAWVRAAEQNAAIGLHVERAPEFLASLEDWFLGAITIQILHQRYIALLTQRHLRLATPTAGARAAAQTDHLQDISGLRIRNEVERGETSRAVAEAWLLEL